MTDYFMPVTDIQMEDIFDGRLNKYGIREKIILDLTSDGYRCLVKGTAFAWVRANNYVLYIGCGRMRPYFDILAAIAESFGTTFFAERSTDFPDRTSWVPVNVVSEAAHEDQIMPPFGTEFQPIPGEEGFSLPSPRIESDVNMVRLVRGFSPKNWIFPKPDLASDRQSTKRGWRSIDIEHAPYPKIVEEGIC